MDWITSHKKVFPIIVFLLFSTISVHLWLKQNKDEKQTIKRYTDTTAEQIQIRVENLMKSCISSLSIMAERWVERRPPDFSQKRFLHFAEACYTHYPGFHAIIWFDSKGKVQWVYPVQLTGTIKGKNIQKYLTVPYDGNNGNTEAYTRFMVTPSTVPDRTNTNFEIFWPVLYDQRLQGFLNGVFQIRKIMNICLPKNIQDHFWIKLYEKDQRIYANAESTDKKTIRNALTSFRHITFPGKIWVLHIKPKASIYEQEKIPNVEFLIFSLLISWTLALAIYFLIKRMALYRVARDQAMHEIKEKEHTQDALQKSLKALDSRVKELNCLFSLSTMVQQKHISRDEILQGTVELIPPALQYPDVACVRIRLQEREFITKKSCLMNLPQSKISSGIIVRGEPYGTIEAYYSNKNPKQKGSTFLKEEHNLIKDISRRLGRIIERKESEQSFRDLVENSLTGIFIIQDNRVVYQNPEQNRLLGGVAHPSIFTNPKNIHPDDVAKVNKFYETVTSGRVKSLETDFRFFPPSQSADRNNMKWVNCRASLVEYRGKEAILVNMMDITTTKELEHLLRIQDKMSSLGRVAAGMAHEIRNPLSGINIYLNTLEKIYERGERPENLKDIIENIHSASAKIEAVIKRVMDFSKPNAPSMVKDDINRPIQEAISLSAVTMRKRCIKIVSHLADDLPLCIMDPQLMEQVILNLITNAAESMKAMDAKKIIEILSDLERNRIIIQVADSGPGIPHHLKEKIFDPFYSTKEGSTGIGLSICHRIVSDHGGKFILSKSKWGGATFTISLPLNEEL